MRLLKKSLTLLAEVGAVIGAAILIFICGGILLALGIVLIILYAIGFYSLTYKIEEAGPIRRWILGRCKFHH